MQLTDNDRAMFERLQAAPLDVRNAITEAVNAARDSLKAAGHAVSYSDPHAALDAAVYRYVLDSAKAPPARRVFEVTAAGFDGSTDETDNRVYWVLADSRQQVAAAIKDCDALVRNEWDAHEANNIDFDLTKPGQPMLLGTKLLEWVGHERNKNRAC